VPEAIGVKKLSLVLASFRPTVLHGNPESRRPWGVRTARGRLRRWPPCTGQRMRRLIPRPGADDDAAIRQSLAGCSGTRHEQGQKYSDETPAEYDLAAGKQLGQ
jgi:hypothetical protein